MTWAKLCDKWHSHPKLLSVSLEAAGFHARAISYCAAHLTDGFVVRRAWPLLAVGISRGRDPVDLVDELADAGLVVIEEAQETGFWLHDYLVYNDPRAKVLADQKRRSERGKKGGKRSGEVRRKRKRAKGLEPVASNDYEQDANNGFALSSTGDVKHPTRPPPSTKGGGGVASSARGAAPPPTVDRIAEPVERDRVCVNHATRHLDALGCLDDDERREVLCHSSMADRALAAMLATAVTVERDRGEDPRLFVLRHAAPWLLRNEQKPPETPS